MSVTPFFSWASLGTYTYDAYMQTNTNKTKTNHKKRNEFPNYFQNLCLHFPFRKLILDTYIDRSNFWIFFFFLFCHYRGFREYSFFSCEYNELFLQESRKTKLFASGISIYFNVSHNC